MEIEKAKATNYFPELTGVRALAVYLVYLHHTNPFHSMPRCLVRILLVVLLSSFGVKGQSGMSTFFGIVINNFLLPVSIAFFFYGLMREKTIIKKILSSRLFTTMGKASYTFYLIHVGVFYMLLRDHLTTNYAVIFLGLNLVVLLLWHFVEEPSNNAIREL